MSSLSSPTPTILIVILAGHLLSPGHPPNTTQGMPRRERRNSTKTEIRKTNGLAQIISAGGLPAACQAFCAVAKQILISYETDHACVSLQNLMGTLAVGDRGCLPMYSLSIFKRTSVVRRVNGGSPAGHEILTTCSVVMHGFL